MLTAHDATITRLDLRHVECAGGAGLGKVARRVADTITSSVRNALGTETDILVIRPAVLYGCGRVEKYK